MHGSGIFVASANGTRYTGRFRDGKFDGEGLLEWPDRKRFKGQFKQDSMKFGVLTWPNGQRFEGSLDNDQLVEGCFQWVDGSKYIGGYLSHKKHGKGVYSWPHTADSDDGSGAQYEGNWHGGL